MWVVLDDEQNGVALFDLVAIVLDVLLASDWHVSREQLWRLACCNAGRRGTLGVGAGVVQRQVEGKSAALFKDARELDFPAEEHGQLTTDGESEAGTAVLAGGASVGLLEGLENEPLLFWSDADAGVLNGEG